MTKFSGERNVGASSSSVTPVWALAMIDLDSFIEERLSLRLIVGRLLCAFGLILEFNK